MEYLPTDRMLEDAEPDASTPENRVKTLLVQLLSNVLLFVLIFGMSATVDIRRIKQQLRNCYTISAGVCMQFLIMPLLGFLAVVTLKRYGLRLLVLNARIKILELRRVLYWQCLTTPIKLPRPWLCHCFMV
jgi:hypothetical protein